MGYVAPTQRSFLDLYGHYPYRAAYDTVHPACGRKRIRFEPSVRLAAIGGFCWHAGLFTGACIGAMIEFVTVRYILHQQVKVYSKRRPLLKTVDLILKSQVLK